MAARDEIVDVRAYLVEAPGAAMEASVARGA